MASRKDNLVRRASRVRRQIKAVANGRPRLSVHRSSKNIYAQIIDDTAGRTLAAASTLDVICPSSSLSLSTSPLKHSSFADRWAC